MNNFEQDLTRAMTYCSRREVCVCDLKKKFETWQTNPEFYEKIISTLIDEKFIDEQRYANAYANDKLKHNNWGKTKIAFQLKQRQLDSQIIKNALDKISEADYAEITQKIITRKLKSCKNDDVFQRKTKVFRHLVSKGFEPDFFMDKLNKELSKYKN